MHYRALTKQDQFSEIGSLLGQLLPMLNKIYPQESDLEAILAVTICATLLTYAPHISDAEQCRISSDFSEAFCRSYELQNWIMERQN